MQGLTSKFEECKMLESETIDEFYARFSDIVNSTFSVGESISEAKHVCKISKSLPKRFRPKVTAIEEHGDKLKNMKITCRKSSAL